MPVSRFRQDSRSFVKRRSLLHCDTMVSSTLLTAGTYNHTYIGYEHVMQLHIQVEEGLPMGCSAAISLANA